MLRQRPRRQAAERGRFQLSRCQAAAGAKRGQWLASLGDTAVMDERLAGGKDEGAELVDGTVRRPARAWACTVHDLLIHLERRGFAGAPRALGFDEQGREVLTYLPGETVGPTTPWPAWTHSDEALVDVARWLREYHAAVADYVPPRDAVWREGQSWEPGLVIGHGDPAPYNAVWTRDGLVGLIDWDNAGPIRPEDDLAWVAFSWTPLHAAEVVQREGFTALSQRRERLALFLRAYGWPGTTDEMLSRIDARLQRQIETMRATASAGDPAYQRSFTSGSTRLSSWLAHSWSASEASSPASIGQSDSRRCDSLSTVRARGVPHLPSCAGEAARRGARPAHAE